MNRQAACARAMGLKCLAEVVGAGSAAVVVVCESAWRSRGQDQRGTIPGITISERPAEAADRAVPGHW